jgi:CheY-like chemotaxis protein
MGRNASSHRLVVVEDDPATARVVERVLVSAGYVVAVVQSCIEAQAFPEGFDGVVLDVDLTDGGGIALGRQLLAARKTRIVVFFTRSMDEATARCARALGPIVDKSRPQDLLEAIATEIRSQVRP